MKFLAVCPLMKSSNWPQIFQCFLLNLVYQPTNMDFEKLIIEITNVLDKLNITYAITGGYAVSIWGRLRATFDIDVVIELPMIKARILAEALKKVSEAGYVDEDMVVRAIKRKGEFNFIHIESGIKVDFWVLGGGEYQRIKLKRREAKSIGGKEVYFLSPEDLILSKLLWYKESGSELQLGDIESILKIQKKIDWKYLNKWAKIHSTSGVLNKLKTRALNPE